MGPFDLQARMGHMALEHACGPICFKPLDLVLLVGFPVSRVAPQDWFGCCFGFGFGFSLLACISSRLLCLNLFTLDPHSLQIKRPRIGYAHFAIISPQMVTSGPNGW